MQSAMNFIKRRFSDTNFNSNLPNGYMVDAEENEADKNEVFLQKQGVGNEGQIKPQPEATKIERSSNSGGFFSSLASGNPLAALKLDHNDKYKTVLVVDDQHTDWTKYFRNKKLHGEYSIQVEQAEFKEITLSSHSLNGVTVDINCFRNGSKLIRSFKPDFVLVRQPPRSMVVGEDFRNLLIGLKYGGVPSVNSLHSQYNFMDKPWTFSQLIRIQKKLGREKFPLIDQTYYPSHTQLVTSSHFPIVLKIGHFHRGMAKFKVNDHYEFQDVVGTAALADTYIVVERYIDAAHDIRVQKIGGNYRSYVRTSVSKNWKANTGSAMLEEVQTTDRHKLWVDACSEMFGGLDMVAVKAIHGKDGKDYIIGVTDCSLPLMGEKQDEDRRMIAELVLKRMTASIRPRPADIMAHRQSHPHMNTDSLPNPPKPENVHAVKSSIMSAPPSVGGSEPPSPTTGRHEHNSTGSSPFHERVNARQRTVSEDDESKAEKIRNLRKSFVDFFAE